MKAIQGIFKQVFAGIIGVTMMLAVHNLSAQTVITRGPYLQKVTSGSIKVMWRTGSPTTGEVRWGTSPMALTQTVTEGTANTNHEVEITGLSPRTTYYYGVGDGTIWHTPADSAFHFTTFPVVGSSEPVRIWATGDFGKGNAQQRQVMQSFLDFNEGEAADLWLWLGDNAYDSGTDSEFQDKVFDSTNAYGSIFPFMPFQPAPGNHDYMTIAPPFSNVNPNNHTGPYYDLAAVYENGESGGVASGTELYYSFDYGDVHFISCNSEIGCLASSSNDWIGAFPYINPFASPFTGSPFTQWLHSDLSANTRRWTVVFFHQPPYTDGSHDATSFWEVYMKAMRENIVPIFEQYDVDLVLSGHSHVYERSHLIHGHYDDANTFNPLTMMIDGSSGTDSIGEAYVKDLAQPNGWIGTVYAVCGNSASKDDAPGLQYPAMYYGYGCDTCIGSMVIDINGDTLNGRYLSAYGEIMDDFTMYKLNGPNANAPAEINAPEITIYPNPSTGSFEIGINSPVAINGNLQISDAMGRILYENPISGKEFRIKMDNKKAGFAEGTYFAIFKIGEKTYTRTILIRD